MALAKDEMPRGHSYYMELLEGGGMYELEEAEKGGGGMNMNIISRSSTSLSSPSSTNSNNHLLYRALNYQHQEAHSVISFKAGLLNNHDDHFVNANESLLSFDHHDHDHYTNLDQFPSSVSNSNVRLLQTFNSVQTTSNKKDNGYDEEFGWLNTEETTGSDTTDHHIIIRSEEPHFHKRPHTVRLTLYLVTS